MSKEDATSSKLFRFYLVVVLLTLRSSNGYSFQEIDLGGLFPIHPPSQESKFKCGKQISFYGFQAYQAMLYAVDKINENDAIMRNISLKSIIFDTCANPTITAGHTKELVEIKILKATSAPLVGVVGAAISDISAKVANILQVFQIPQISYASTSVLLSNKDDYSYFLRTVAPDSFQVQAMVDICLEFKWTYVMTVSSVGLYGTKGIEGFIELAQHNGICTDPIPAIKPLSRINEYDKIVANIVERSHDTGGTVVVLFCTTADGNGIIRAVQRNKRASKFNWLASDAWDTTTTDLHNTSVFKIQTVKGNTTEDFKHYFESLNPNKPRWQNDIYLREFWEQIFGCGLNNTSSLPKCTGNESLQNISFPIIQFHSVINAVNAFAQSLDHHQKKMCPEVTGTCDEMSTNFEGDHIMKHLMENSFTDSMNSTMRFNENGEVEARYVILHFQEVNNEKKYVQVGTWISGRDKNGGKRNLDLKHRKIQWHSVHSDPPTSYCSTVCPFGSVKLLRPGYNFTCCWSCHVCTKLQTIINNTCLDGLVGYVPTKNRTAWVKRDLMYLKWNDQIPTFLITASGLGIVLTMFTWSVFIVFYNNRTVKASSREASFIILGGILLCFTNPLLYIAKPTDPMCYARKLSVGLALAIIYASVFMKLNRVYRIFQSAKKSARRPALVRPRQQILITSALVSIHLLFITMWFLIAPTHAIERYDTIKEKLHLECNTKAVNFVGSLLYVIVLKVLCTIYAFKTRKFPKNFNESKYIGITLYTTCVMSTLFLAFFLNAKDKMMEDLLIAGASIGWGLIALIGLFAQRVYVIFFVEETQQTTKDANVTTLQALSQSKGKEILLTNFKRTAKVSNVAVNNKNVKVKKKGFKKRSLTF